jgi:DNA-binding transcriptional LysR family regulator
MRRPEYSRRRIRLRVNGGCGTMKFELRDLECFLRVVEHRSFGRAAAALGITQPAVSRRIAGLERGLGVALFSRAHPQIELTVSGESLWREASAVLAQAAIAQRVLHQASRGSKGYLRIGTRSGARYVLIPEAIRRLRLDYPEISITLGDPMLPFKLEQVREGTFDVGFVRGPVDLRDGFNAEQLRSDPLVVALPDRHRLAGKSMVGVRELAMERFVEFALHRGFGSKALVRGVCAAAGFIPNVVQEAETVDVLVTSVAAGIGIALMYDASRELAVPGVVYRPLRHERKMVPMYAVWRARDPNPMIAPFVRHLKEAAKSLDAPAPPQRRASH